MTAAGNIRRPLPKISVGTPSRFKFAGSRRRNELSFGQRRVDAAVNRPVHGPPARIRRRPSLRDGALAASGSLWADLLGLAMLSWKVTEGLRCHLLPFPCLLKPSDSLGPGRWPARWPAD